MKDDLRTTTYTSSDENYLHCYTILNNDKTIRWAWPKSNTKPVFLRFYSSSTLKSKLYKAATKTIFYLGLQRFIYKSKKVEVSMFKDKNEFDFNTNWAFFTGTPGLNRKVLLTGQDKAGKTQFCKIPSGQNSHQLVANEASTIENISKQNYTCFKHPAITNYHNGSLTISGLKNLKSTTDLTSLHIKALKEIEAQTKQSMKIKTSLYWENISTKMNQISTITNTKIPHGIRRKLRLLLATIQNQDLVSFNLAHGDFTPWNCTTSKDELNIYDWELSAKEMPKAFDAFHYVIQTGILIHKQSWKTIYSSIQETILIPFFKGDRKALNAYLTLYLLHITTYYLPLYAAQKDWHVQINWLLATWNDALSDMLQETVQPRKLLLMDAFDFIQNLNYSTLKFNSILPEEVALNSDVDLCMSSKNAAVLLDYLKNHSLVDKVKIRKLSFMANATLLTKNGQLLSIDTIWKLKRKHLVMQNINDLLNSTISNAFGIKHPSFKHESLYINNFYALNNAEVPDKYKDASFEYILEKESGSVELKSKGAVLAKRIKTLPSNMGFSGFINKVNYFLDCIVNSVTNQGFIITFSGVDGAGKSTVIEELKTQLNKQIRRPVVVLRHRPSLLPIISAFKYGKKGAEKRSVEKLPRQGENASMVSSILRFSYYYTDYIVGQFYVYFKYVMRGKVVLYDRFYFDFINDGKRSNIDVPKWLTLFGYNFILKPNLNFFLYADAETILKRKQELDKDTIVSLTVSYIDLFKAFNTNKTDKKYIPINNIELSTTLETVMHSIKTKAA